MPSNLRLNRQDLSEFLRGNPKFIRAFEEMFAQTTEILPDQVNLLLTLITSVSTSAESAAAYADDAQKAAEAALATFATLPQPVDYSDQIAALGAQIAAIPDAPETIGIFYAEAAEDLARGDVVDVYDDAGTTKTRLAIADASDYEAVGFMTTDCATGQTAKVQTLGNVPLTGLTTGAYYYLSDINPGEITTTAPTTIGHVVQNLGRAVSPTELAFKPVPGIFVV